MQSDEIKALGRRMDDAEMDIATLKNKIEHMEETQGTISEILHHQTTMQFTMAPLVKNKQNKPLIEYSFFVFIQHL